MKAILEYNLNNPEDKEVFNIASKAMEWSILVWDIDQMLRSKIKNGHTSHEVILQEIRNELKFQMEENGLQFPK